MGYQITTPEVAYWVPNCFWAIPHPFGVSPEVCVLLGIAKPVLCPLKVWQLHRSRPGPMGPSQARVGGAKVTKNDPSWGPSRPRIKVI